MGTELQKQRGHTHGIRETGCTVLIVAPPGRLRDGLQALVRAAPQVKCAVWTADSPSTLRMIAEHLPVLVLLDADLPDEEAWTVLGQIKARWPQIPCIALVHNGVQNQMANALSADAVLVKGFSAQTLARTMEDLLSPMGANDREG